MKPWNLFFLFVFLYIPINSYANSMAPILPLINIGGWFALPIIICIEGLILKKQNIEKPIKLAIYSNLISSLVGLVPAALTFWLMLGPVSERELELLISSNKLDFARSLLLVSTIACTLAFIFNWWLSSFVEHKFTQKNKYWKKLNLPRSLFYKINGITYSLLFLVYGYGAIQNILIYLRGAN